MWVVVYVSAYTLDRAISASHWEHDHYAPAHRSRGGDNEP